jgi:hypothetical protein
MYRFKSSIVPCVIIWDGFIINITVGDVHLSECVLLTADDFFYRSDVLQHLSNTFRGLFFLIYVNRGGYMFNIVILKNFLRLTI